LCNGGNTGSINSSIAGGTGTFTYAWSNAATTANISGLGIGTYSLTVSDNICTASQSATITQPSALSLSVASSTNAGCGALANGGSVNITIAGGTNPYRFLWSNGATSQNIANLVVGNYTVTVSDNNNCNTTVSQNITSGGIAAQLVSAVDTICFGTNTGAITATATPSAGASFVWSNGATGTSINNLAAGTYTVTATNVNAGITCTDVLTVVVRQPVANLATIVTEVQPLDCSGNDVAELSNTATGGWGGYQYNWSNGGQSSNIAGIGAGDYTITVTDAQGCQTSATGNIAAIVIPQVDAWVVSVGANSATVDVGTIVNINAGNNQAGVSYVWTPNTNVLAPNSAATTITANDAGTFIYTIVATAGNCSDTDSIELIVRAAFLGMPTAFTPNGDGENDFFRPAQLNAQYVKSFRIFNRWGEIIYDNADISNGGWDGTYKGALQPRDAYIYFLEYQLPQDAEPIKLRGEFTLVR
jgi:gliding motility-associated-like protein